ncbi:MAG TPA: AgmX/PglI C-terminal domain-containing protein [Polyangiaceae bacterium]
MRRTATAMILGGLVGCASTPPPATSALAADSSSAPGPASATTSVPPVASAPPAAPVVPTGGSVMIGDINAPKGFKPKPVIDALAGDLVHCYDEARAVTPDLRGKVTLRILINEAGAVLSVDAEPGGHANDPGLVSCVNDLMKASAHFPKPGGTATVLAPLVFRP